MRTNRNTTFPKNILLIEDDSDDQEFITEAFLRIENSLAVHTVAKSSNVLDYLQNLTDSQLPQLILLDYNLPELDGGDVLQTLARHSRYQAIPKIVWSTSNSPQSKSRCLALGATSYFVKPSCITGLETLARDILQLGSVAA